MVGERWPIYGFWMQPLSPQLSLSRQPSALTQPTGPPGEPPTIPDSLSHCRDGLPYCEADYHTKFGIRCDGCEKYITGHVLEVSGSLGALSEACPAPLPLTVSAVHVCLCKNLCP